MIRLLFVIPLCALASSQAIAQNKASQILLALVKTNGTRPSCAYCGEAKEKCDRIIRTLFNGTELGLDEWEALCHDRNSYSFIVPPDLSAGIELVTGIELVSCHELLATDKMLLHRARGKSKGDGLSDKMGREANNAKAVEPAPALLDPRHVSANGSACALRAVSLPVLHLRWRARRS
jgi:hypothetical protein